MRTIQSFVSTCVTLLILATPVTAPESPGSNHASSEIAAKAKSSAEAEAVQQIHLAHMLIEYGRKHKVPEALITAARILAANGTVELEQEPDHESSHDAPQGKRKEKPVRDDSPRSLLQEAKNQSSNNPAILSLANSVEVNRGAVGGPKRTVEVVEPQQIDSYKITFRGGEVARAAVSGDGDTRLDMYVYDENGNPITSHVGPGDDCLASWIPKWIGVFLIKVVNRGRVPNRYVIVTN